MPSASADPDSLVRQAVGLLNDGEGKTAEAACREVLRAAPGHAGALGVLSVALQLQRRFGEAVPVLAELTLLEPEERAHWINLGNALRNEKRYDEGLKAFAHAAHLGEASAAFYFNVGLLHVDRCDYESARSVLERALALVPRDAETRYWFAQACYETMRNEEAVAALASWQDADGLTTRLTAQIASLLMNLGEGALAAQAVERASADLAPEPEAALILVQILERTNRLEEARARLRLLKESTDARIASSERLRIEAQLASRAGRHDDAEFLYREALRDSTESHLRHVVLFPLARALDAQQRYREAWAMLLEAHRSQTEYLQMAVPALALRGSPTLEIADYGCDAGDFADWRTADGPAAEDSPVFIVAFPRSGTTLLEQALDAHPQLRSMDEQPYLQNALEDIVAAGARYPEVLKDLTAGQLEEIRARYWQRVGRRLALSPGQRLIDKNPLNILRLTVIRRLFPNARILLALRHPCDVVLSCFMQHFRAADFAMLCSELTTLATGYARTFGFWYREAELLLPTVRELRYESLVSRFEPEMREICQFLELEWDEAMLLPAEHALAKGFISTPSYSQVVGPVTTRSVDRWRAYAGEFAPIMPVLQPWIARLGYAGDAT